MFTPILVSMTMAIICDETVNYWWGAQRWGNAKVGLADSRRERDARPAGKQTKAEMTGIKNWDSISSTALHQEGYTSSGNSRNDNAPDNYNNPVHLVHQADLNALAQARVGRWWILRREGRTGNHHHHQLTSLFSTPLPSESSSSATPSALSTHFYPLHKSLYFLRKLSFFYQGRFRDLSCLY